MKVLLLIGPVRIGDDASGTRRGLDSLTKLEYLLELLGFIILGCLN